MPGNKNLPELVDQRNTVQWKDTSDGESDRTEDLENRSNHSESSAAICEAISDTHILELSEEGKISELLRGWMPDYILQHIEPHESKDKEPLYSAKLGIEPRIKRCSSSESIVTELSLLSCSTYGKSSRVSETTRRKRRNKRPPTTTDNASTISKWALAMQGQKHGAFDKLMRQQNAFQITPGATNSVAITAFDLMDEEEKTQVLKCGRESWIKMNPRLKKSDSITHINTLSKNKLLQSKRRFSQIPTSSKNGRMKPFVRILNGKNSSNDSEGISVAMLDKQTTRTVTPPFKEKVRMWQVDEKISDVDLNRGMSAKVRERIASTTMALDRVSRKSASRPQSTAGCIRTDPNNPQNIRISPELGDVIKQDIKSRMGRPRQHEIRQQDVENLNHGYTLDRSHRNLKVFNWLHSLKEGEFVTDDKVDGETDRSLNSMSIVHVHVDAVDEPKLKPINFGRSKSNLSRELTFS
ncbi:hypothetical protein LOTGIDRAFT_162170 [Lottia gigantea]|uniref:Uncharacterized protein n=1 Tax=Lottia gigantea TaxID=225164 RepID=V4AI85_LOTGI|nr:hypothetical protein LOTGIDRAFT_162170 [Lottia gigantea]ESO93141.1 hypothetical protein LOTGIDRAFT_162170 [Lottia gigantea]